MRLKKMVLCVTAVVLCVTLLVAGGARYAVRDTAPICDATGGTVIGSSKVGEWHEAAPIDHSMVRDTRTHHLFVVDGMASPLVRSKVVMLSPTGRVLRTTELAGEATAAAVAPLHGLLFVANGTRPSVSVLSTATGSLLRTIPVGLPARTIAVDEAAGEFVVARMSSDLAC